MRCFNRALTSHLVLGEKMGCCQSSVNEGAFCHNIHDTDLINGLLPKLGDETRVCVLRLVGLADIPIGNTYKTWSDAFVELQLLPHDPVVGGQKQISSTKPSTLSPKWVS
jgi:hypothetical protein